MKTIIIFVVVFCSFSAISQSKLIFAEEFNETTLNDDFWNYGLGDGCPNLCGWGNNERQIYNKENIRLADGNLIITATKTDSLYYSGRISTKGKVEMLYGRIEVRAKLGTGSGIWPAIWMLGSNIDERSWPGCGEIDIMEYVGKEPNTLYTSLHTAESFGNTINTKKTIIENIEDGFHIYKAIWTKDSISFYMDETLVYVYDPIEKNEDNWPFNKPFYVLLNLAVGGNFGGPYVDDSIFPSEFTIDYLRIYEN